MPETNGSQNQRVLSGDRIRSLYDSSIAALNEEYVHFRWGATETQRRHYRQTFAAIAWHVGRMGSLGATLEIGCGPAVWTPLLLEQASGMTLLDISIEMLNRAREKLAGRAGVEFALGDFVEEQTAVPGRPFDTVATFRAFEYMSDKQRAVSRMFDLLKPGGRLLLITKNAAWRDFRALHSRLKRMPLASLPPEQAMQADVRHWTDVEAMCRSAGFADAVSYPVVIGSYGRFCKRTPALWFFDRTHARVHRLPMQARWDAWTESYAVVATKPR